MPDGPTDALPPGDVAGTGSAGASADVRARIEALTATSRDLSDSCADLADALRPGPGSEMDDPLTMDFGRLRAERTATLLDEAASAAHGTFGLLDAAHAALEEVEDGPADDATPADGLAAVPAALAGWVVVDPDETNSEPVALEHRPTGPLPATPPGSAAAAAGGPTMLTVHTDRDDAYAHDDLDPFGEAASSEPRALTLVPPLPPSEAADPAELGSDPLSPDLPPEALVETPSETPSEIPAAGVTPYPGEEGLAATGYGPWIPEPAPGWAPRPAATAEPDPAPVPEEDWTPVGRSIWAVDPVPGASPTGIGVPVYPLDEPAPFVAEAAPVTPAEAALPPEPVDDPAAAVVARQVEAARRHLQAALVVANGAPHLGALLSAVERALTGVTDLARDTRGVLDPALADRTFPGEARFVCAGPWETAAMVGREPYPDEAASPAELAKLLRALGYDARSVTSASGVAGVQIRQQRYAAHIALVEPAGGGRQRWSGALEWTDAAGASRTWAETLGPVELEEEELARRVDELLRRSIGPAEPAPAEPAPAEPAPAEPAPAELGLPAD